MKSVSIAKRTETRTDSGSRCATRQNLLGARAIEGQSVGRLSSADHGERSEPSFPHETPRGAGG